MIKRLTQFMFIVLALGFAFNAKAGVIIRPVLNTGLVGYWNLQEGAGNTAYDKSGNGHHGTLTNMTEDDWVDGRIGKALEFDGSDDYVEMDNTSGDVLSYASDAVTISFWGRCDTTLTTFRAVMAIHDGTNAIFIAYFKGSSENGFVYDFVKEGITSSIPSSYVDSTSWHYYTITWNGNSSVLYIDGINASKTSGTSNLTPPNLQNVVLLSRAYSDFYGKNTFDEVRIYNRILSESEIKRLYKLTSPKILAPTNSGLVGYWSFEEGKGTIAGDMSGNGHHGTLTNMTEDDWVDGRIGQALEFDGSDDYVNFGNDESLRMTDALTVSFWVNASDISSPSPWVVSRWLTTGDGERSWGVIIYSEDGTVRFYVSYNGTSSAYAIGPSITVDEWFHISAVYNGSQLIVYVNGVAGEPKNHALGIFDSTANVIISGYNNGASQEFNGLVDEFRIYNRALSADEIESLYNSSKLAKINTSQNNRLTDGLVGLWSFNGPDMGENTAYDRSGNNNHGTLVNGPTPAIGKVGQALEFNDNYINISNESNFDLTDEITITSWVYFPTGNTGYYPTIISKGYTTTWSTMFYGTTRIPRFYLIIDGVQKWDHGDTACPLDEWCHVAYTYGDGYQRTYVNGTLDLDNELTGNIDTNNTSVKIGKDGSSAYYFDGSVDEVRIYNRALSAQEISQLYNMGR